MDKKRLNLPFTGIASFFRAPICEDWSKINSDVAILGVPFDQSTAVRPGARYGPRGIREASSIFRIGEYYDFELDETFMEGVTVTDCGDVDMIHMDPHQCLQNTYEAVGEILQSGALPVIVGGDHAVPIPVLRAFKDRGPIHVIQFDAHLDFTDERFGVTESHGNPMRRISEMDHVSGMTQIGIRGQGSSGRSDFEDARKYGSTIIGAREFKRYGPEKIIKRIPESTRYYVTIDCDVLDPALAPGTGTPFPGGLDYYELMDSLRGIAQRGEVIGFDFCEVAPVFDPSGVTCHLAAQIILEFVSAIFKYKSKRES